MTQEVTIRPVDDGQTLIGYELVRDEQRLGFIHLEDIVSKSDPAAFFNEWIERVSDGGPA